MKAVCLGLLLVNLLVLGWVHWLVPEQARVTQAVDSNVPTLVLASEAQATIPRPRTAALPSSSGRSPASSAPPPAVVSEDAVEGAAAAPEGAGDSADRPEPELLTAVQRCVSIGVFRNLAEATQASATLRGSGYEPRTRVAEGDVWAGLWVHLRDLSSRSEAQRAMTLLKQRGITDAYIMPSGDGGSEISLGIFSEPARAQRRAEDVRALGFTPTIADRTRRGTVYWIDIDLKATDGFIDPADIHSESGKIVRLEVKACPAADRAAG